MAERPRILWLHTQPEHYFNCMMDDLTREWGDEFEFVTAFVSRGPGLYQDNPQPKLTETVFLRERPGAGHAHRFFQRANVDWRADLAGVKFEAAIVSGYGRVATRGLLLDCRRRGIPVAMWSDSNLRGERGRGMGRRLRRVLKKAWLQRVIASADYLLTANSLGIAYWRYYGCPASKIVLCPCYSDYQRVEEAMRRPRAEVLAQFGLGASDRLLFTSARLAPVKGLDLAIRAFRAGGFAQRGWKYLIAGTGPLKEELTALAGDEAGRSIRLLGFQEPRNNLAAMAQADLFLLPSRYEPHGIVIGESLAVGTPVLTSDVCGASIDLVLRGAEDGAEGAVGTGDLFRSEDEADLREKLTELLGNPERLHAMRGPARAHFERWFAATSPVRVVGNLMRQLLAERGRPMAEPAAGEKAGGA